MAEYISNPIQLVGANQNVLLTERRGCNRGYILHREGSGIITLRGIVNNACANSARYQITFNGNIAIPTGGTVGPIALAIAINGEADQASRSIYTPAAVEQYGVASCTTYVDVPRGCCYTIAVENVLASDDPTDTVSAINVQNANLVVNRTA